MKRCIHCALAELVLEIRARWLSANSLESHRDHLTFLGAYGEVVGFAQGSLENLARSTHAPCARHALPPYSETYIDDERRAWMMASAANPPLPDDAARGVIEARIVREGPPE